MATLCLQRKKPVQIHTRIHLVVQYNNEQEKRRHSEVLSRKPTSLFILVSHIGICTQDYHTLERFEVRLPLLGQAKAHKEDPARVIDHYTEPLPTALSLKCLSSSDL